MRPIDGDELRDRCEIIANPAEWFSHEQTTWMEAAKTFADMVDDAPTIDAEWELFQRITDAYYDKQMFFLQDDGSVYDREKAAYHSSIDEAIDAFVRRIS